MNIHGHKVVLRAIEESDLPQLHQWANDPEIWHRLGGWHHASGLASMQAWYEKLGSDAGNRRYAITTRGEGQLIGTANLVSIDMKNGNATHGMMLGPVEARRQGYGRDTVMAVMRHAFEELRLNRLDSDIIEYNTASYGLYVGACGWREEGRQRGWHYRQGRYWDRFLIGVTREDYVRLISETAYWDGL